MVKAIPENQEGGTQVTGQVIWDIWEGFLKCKVICWKKVEKDFLGCGRGWDRSRDRQP